MNHRLLPVAGGAGAPKIPEQPVTWPTVVYNEEVMREGFGIEDAEIPLETRVSFMEALSSTGLRHITVGAFVSPRFVPQMADFEELLKRITPKDGVVYQSFIHNQKARELAQKYSPPLTVAEEDCALFIDICDVHQRRNVNRSIEQVMDSWPTMIEAAMERGVRSGRVGIASAWGSNFMGKFPRAYRMSMLARQIDLLQHFGLPVTEIGLHDSQSFSLPHEIEEDLREIRQRWPDIRRYHLHLHDARAMALPGIYAAMRTLGDGDTLIVDGTLGGIGGGQYSGNGRAAGMIATEDFIHMLEGMNIQTGVDLDRLIDCVWRLEQIIGRPTCGHVAKAGPRPINASSFYDPNMPGIETLEEARHFRSGPGAYANSTLRPWKQPITGPYFSSSPSHGLAIEET